MSRMQDTNPETYPVEPTGKPLQRREDQTQSLGHHRCMPCRHGCSNWTRYFAYELEALGVLKALMRWQDDLMGGHEFTIIMDHESLEYFKAKNHNSGRHLRWQAFFTSFNCEIKYVEGHKNKVADALSCYYDSSTDEDLHFDDN